MKEIIRWVKKLCGKYEPNCEYWINLSEIHIPASFETTRIGADKYKNKWIYYKKHGECESKIILNKDFLLVNGYTSYKIYESADVGKVPVFFINE